MATFLNRKFGGLIASIETVAKEDLDLVRSSTPWNQYTCSLYSPSLTFSLVLTRRICLMIKVSEDCWYFRYCQEKLDHSLGFILSNMVQSTIDFKLFFMISLPSRIITLLGWKEITLSCHFSLLMTWWKWRGKIFDKRLLFYTVLFTDYK